MSSEFVTLRAGYTVPAEALRLAWQLEERGYRLLRDGDRLRLHGHAESPLTNGDGAAIRRWRLHLLEIVDYCERAREEPA